MDDDDLIPLSALQHWLVCPRQCALIHLEQAWVENAATAEGRLLHEKVDQGGEEVRGNLRIVRGLPLRSARLGLSGKADTVEFRGTVPFPIEHKRGAPKGDDRDRVQLCAQALCLEEMLGVEVPAGALFYYRIRRREDVAFDAALRRRTTEAAQAVRAMIESGRTPPPVPVSACGGCSLKDICLPDALAARGPRSVADYFAQGLGGR